MNFSKAEFSIWSPYINFAAWMKRHVNLICNILELPPRYKLIQQSHGGYTTSQVVTSDVQTVRTANSLYDDYDDNELLRPTGKMSCIMISSQMFERSSKSQYSVTLSSVQEATPMNPQLVGAHTYQNLILMNTVPNFKCNEYAVFMRSMRRMSVS